jgi:hypothetical protein
MTLAIAATWYVLVVSSFAHHALRQEIEERIASGNDEEISC